MFQPKLFWSLFGGYVGIRLFSYWFGPATPLYAEHWLNTMVSLAIALVTLYLLIKKDKRGWYTIALELILGGSGSYFSVAGVSLRTILLISLPIFFIQQAVAHNWREILRQDKRTVVIFLMLIGAATIATFNGWLHQHSLSLIIADAIPYTFLLYYFPLRQLLKDQTFIQLTSQALCAAVAGNALLIILTLAGFSSGLLVLQDNYYHWYRDVAGGKITELPLHYYRLVLNEHLLLVPVLIYFVSQIVKKQSWHFYSILSGLLLMILAVNLTRAYLLALVVGLVALITKINCRRWLLTIASLTAFFVVIFTSLHLAASRGQSLGWELFGVRLQSIVTPQTEDSSLSRLLLLPKIVEKIKDRPVLGQGLGDTVTVYSPVFKQEITTPHFDWGYFEITAEMGLIGLLAWIALLAFIFQLYKHSSLEQWQLASVLALMTINLTSPALFHVLGLVWLTQLLASRKNT